MLLKVFAIRDGKADYYAMPFFKHSQAEAERDFYSLANDEKSMIARFPEDYDLYFMGEYDNHSGKLNSLDSPQHIVKAAMVVNKSQNISQ